jgi:hypothetical protein
VSCEHYPDGIYYDQPSGVREYMSCPFCNKASMTDPRAPEVQKLKADLSGLPMMVLGNRLYPAGRVETGPLQINEDWPGIFIRGDSAMFYRQELLLAASLMPKEFEHCKEFLEGFAELLSGAIVGK